MSVIAIFFLVGCKDSLKTTVVSGGDGDLSNPSIQPQVVFTLPSSGSTGPFKVFNPGDGVALPSFVIQFNKLMSTYSIQTGTIICSGFDKPVRIALHSQSAYPVYKMGKVAAYDDVLEFDVRDSSSNSRMYYEVGKTYSVTVNTSIEDINGNHLLQPYTFSFTPEPYFRVVTTYPANGTKDILPAYTYAYVVFNNIVSPDAASLLQLSPAVGGKWSVQGNSRYISFISTSPFNFNTTYTLIVPSTVKDQDGHALHESVASTFTTTGFRVSSTSPANGEENVTHTYLYFNFTGALDTGSVRSAFNISPYVAGTFQFYNSSQFQFLAENGFSMNTKYTITLSPSLQSASGVTLSPYSMSFTTAPFQVDYSYPSDGSTDVSLNNAINIQCNAFVDTASARSAFSISPATAGTFQLYRNSNSFSFMPINGLLPGTKYSVTISTALRTLQGDVLSSPYSFSFTTDQFRVTSSYPYNGATSVYRNSNISISCNAPLDTSTIRSAFSISPTVAGTVTYSASSHYFYFYPSVSYTANTTYTYTVSTALKSASGGALASPFSASFTTGQ